MRSAQTGSNFCHSHRNQKTTPLKANPMNTEDKVLDLDLWIPRAAVLTKCDFCGHIRPGVEVVPDSGGELVVCRPCASTIAEVQKHVHELCRVPGGILWEDIIEDLEAYGFDAVLIEKLVDWLHATGAVIYHRKI